MLYFVGLLLHKKIFIILSILSKICGEGFGRDSRICVILEISRLLIIVILPKSVNCLGVQILIKLKISEILLPRLDYLIALDWGRPQILHVEMSVQKAL